MLNHRLRFWQAFGLQDIAAFEWNLGWSAYFVTLMKMSPKQTELLLQELCVDLGFCLPPDAANHIIETPESDVDSFTDAVIRAEGLDPCADISRNLRRNMRATVLKYFQAEEDTFPD